MGGASENTATLLVVGDAPQLAGESINVVACPDAGQAAALLAREDLRCALLVRHAGVVDDLEALAARHPGVALIVDRPAESWAQDEELVLRGAQDCIDLDVPFDGLAGLVRRAVVRQARTARTLERALGVESYTAALERELDRLRAVGTLGATTTPLAERLPQVESDAVVRYTNIVIASLESALEHGESRTTPRLRALAEDLVQFDCGPRDIVAIHTAAARTLAESAEAADLPIYLDEMRLVLVALLGLVAAEYRRRLVAMLDPTVADEPELTARFRLFTAGTGRRTSVTRRNLERICHEAYGDGYEVEIVDVERDPAAAERHLVLVTPTLDRIHPLPVRRLTGDLSSEDKVRLALDLPLATEV